MRVLVDADVMHIAVYRAKSGHMVTTTTPHKYLHRVVAERAIGKPLPPKAQVHHVNENKADNRRLNLVVCPNDSYHRLLHARTRIVDVGGNPNTQKICGCCKTLKSKEEFSTFARMWDGRAQECRECTNWRRRAA